MTKANFSIKSLFSKIQNNKFIVIEYVVALYFLMCCVQISVLLDTISGLYYIVHDFMYIFFIPFGLKILLDIIESKKIPINIFIFILIAAFVQIFSKNIDLYFLAVLIPSLKGCNLKSTIKKCMIAIGTFYFIIIFLSLIGVVPDWWHERNGIIRHSYGFCYPTDFFSIFLSLVLMLIFVRETKISYVELAIILVLDVILFILTDGRLSFILIILSVILALLIKLIKRYGKQNCEGEPSKLIVVFFSCLPVAIFTISICLSLLYPYDIKLINALDNLLSGRIALGAEAFNNYGVSVFGKKIQWFGWGGHGYRPTPENFSYNFVDCAYLKILFDYGIIATALILSGYTFTMRKALKENNVITVTVLSIVLIWAFVEPILFVKGINVFVLLLCPLFFRPEIDIRKLLKNKKN